ncbi:TlpA family protein disulfide reductase [Caldimonas sp. KR1-144]|uniref:TlpA family protein disulfide reductase n=1 Tax=Caldimonas sp. KR1-144 TaxID=3400911 RepID=UPI003C02A2B7
MPRRRDVLAALCTLGTGAAAAQAERRIARFRRWPANQPTPATELPGWDGGAPLRLAELRGQVVVLNFWASWCEPCRSELPSLELLDERHGRDGLRVIAVNYRETDGTLKRFLSQWPLSLPIVRDADGAAARAWQVRVFPTTAVVARDGRAAFVVTGEVDWISDEALGWLRPLLQSRRP